jgi:hypothetical protein
MSFRPRDALLAASGLALIATAFLATPRLHTGNPRSVASVPPSAAIASPLNTPPEMPLPVLQKFVFDCSPFAPAAARACPEPSADERALLDVSNSYRVTPLPAWSAELADRADAAMAAAARLDPRKLAPLERAALQNAALMLLSESLLFKKDTRAQQSATTARGLLKRFALTQTELTTLPGAEVVTEWLGDGTAWQRGVAPKFFHTASDAFARAHRQLIGQGELADVVRLVLIDKGGVPFVSDVVERVVIRRTEADSVRVCIAELDPLTANCGMPGALHALDPARGQRVIMPGTSAPCSGCHVNNRPGSASFGPSAGFEMDKPVAARIKDILESALRQ